MFRYVLFAILFTTLAQSCELKIWDLMSAARDKCWDIRDSYESDRCTTEMYEEACGSGNQLNECFYCKFLRPSTTTKSPTKKPTYATHIALSVDDQSYGRPLSAPSLSAEVAISEFEDGIEENAGLEDASIGLWSGQYLNFYSGCGLGIIITLAAYGVTRRKKGPSSYALLDEMENEI